MKIDEIPSLLNEAIVADTGMLIEYLSGTTLGKQFDEYIFSNPDIHSVIVTDLTITEIYYIFCRMRNKKDSIEMIQEFLQTVEVTNSDTIRILAGDIKCQRKLSLADCYSIACGIYHNIPVIFKTERELELEISRQSFDTAIILLDA